MRPEEIYAGDTVRHWREGDSRCCLIDRPMVMNLARQAVALAPQPISIVDLGCGTGRWTSRLAGLATRVYGIDRSPDMLVTARERFGASNIQYMQEDIFALSRLFRSSSQALVVSLMALQYVVSSDRLAELFAQIERVLIPGGTFLALVPHPIGIVSGQSRWLTAELPADFDRRRTNEITIQIRNTSEFWTPPLRIFLHPRVVYTTALEVAGLRLEAEFEPVPGAEHIAQYPELAGECGPLGLILQATKQR